MSLYNIYMDIKSHGIETVILVYFILKFIEVTPIKLNPWSSLKKAVQRFFIGDTPDKLEKLENNVNSMKEDQTNSLSKIEKLESDICDLKDGQKDLKEEQTCSIAKTQRYRIIRFDDEMCQGILHSDDHKEEIMDDIGEYEPYCEERPWIKNHKGKAAMARIKYRYDNKLPM